VDTLIKEMEDKRKNVIVILAGYEGPMNTFFDSNPGFKSRVPFSFHFEDYTCPQLYDIGKLNIRKKKLELPSDESSYQTSIRFATSCCDKLEECEENPDTTNGRGARSAVEAGIREMAARFIANKKKGGSPPSRSAYVQMEIPDFAKVAQQLVKDQLEGPCAEKGEVSRYINGIESGSNLEKNCGELNNVLRRFRLISGQTLQVQTFFSSDTGSMTRAQKCGVKLKQAKDVALTRLAEELSGSSEIDNLVLMLRSPSAEINTRNVVLVLTGAMKDQEYRMEVLSTLMDSQEYNEDEQQEVKEVVENVRAKIARLRQSQFQLSFKDLAYI